MIREKVPFRRRALGLYKWCEHALIAALFHRRQNQPRLNPLHVRRVLLMRYDRLGDYIITTPLIDALSRLNPDIQIDVLAGPANRVLPESDPRVHDVPVWQGTVLRKLKLIRWLRRHRYDLVFHLFFNQGMLPSLLAGLFAGKHGRVVGKLHRHTRRMLDYNAYLPAGAHFAVLTLDIMRACIQCPPPQATPVYSIIIPHQAQAFASHAMALHALGEKEFVILNISSGKRSRELSDAQNREIIGRLTGAGMTVVLVAAPDARDRADGIAAGLPGVLALHTPSLLALAAVMQYARLVITPDTAQVHLASAVGAPVVALYAQDGDPPGWAPLGVPHRIVRALSGQGMQGINPDVVYAAVRDLLAVSM